MIERLESRYLLSTISVNSFGAVGNGSHDDTTAIQAAINSANSGDTVQFSKEQYAISQTLNLKSGITYQGGGATIDWKGGQIFAMATANNATDILITNITLNGAGLKYNGICDNCGFANSIVENISFFTNTVNDDGVYIAGLHDSTIFNVHFINMKDHGILGYHIDNDQITNNYFDTIQGDCIQILFEDATAAQNVVISNNMGVNLGRMGIEVQSINGNTNATVGMLVQYNNFSGYLNLNPNTPPNKITNNTFGMSIVQNGFGTIISNNSLDGGVGSDWGLEIAGTGTEAIDNTIIGHNVGIAIAAVIDGLVSGNTLLGQTQTAILEYLPGQDVGTLIQNNTISTQLPDTPAQNIFISVSHKHHHGVFR